MADNGKSIVFSVRLSERNDKEVLYFVEKMTSAGKSPKEVLYALYSTYIMVTAGENIGEGKNAVAASIDTGSLAERLADDKEFGSKIAELQEKTGVSMIDVISGSSDAPSPASSAKMSQFDRDILAEAVARKVVEQLAPHLGVKLPKAEQPQVIEVIVNQEPKEKKTASKPDWKALIEERFDKNTVERK